MPARKTSRVKMDKMRHRRWTPPGEELFQRLAQKQAASHGTKKKAGSPKTAIQAEKSDHDSDGNCEVGTGAQRRHIFRGLRQPFWSYRDTKIVRPAQSAKQMVINCFQASSINFRDVLYQQPSAN